MARRRSESFTLNMIRAGRTFALSVLLFVISISFAEAALFQLGPDFDKKVQIYNQIYADPQITDLMSRIERDPTNQALTDELLIRLPISPLELFEIDLAIHHHELAVPKYIYERHLRWLHFHPFAGPVQPQQQDNSALDMFLPELSPESPVVPLAPLVGTNRDEAYTLSSPNGGPLQYQGEIQLFVNKNNPLQMIDSANTWNACGANPNGTQDIFASTDGGVTWNYNCAPDAAAYSGLACGGTHFGSDPAVAWDNSGNAYLNYMMICGNNAAIVVAKSTNQGTTWSALGVVTGYANLNDKNFYVIDNTPASAFFNRHYSCWDLNNNERIAYSSNGGSTWTTVNTPSGTRAIDIGCDMAVRDDGRVYLIWDGLTCTSSCTGDDTYFSRSTNGGVNWSAAITVAPNKNLIAFSTQTAPPAENQRGIDPFGSIDIDNNSASACYHNLYVSYTNLAASGTQGRPANVYVRRSTDDGATWSAQVQVNDDAVGTASTTTQWHPWLQVDQTDGSVVIAWQDTRNFSSNDRRMEVFVSRSTNCGVNWEANIKVAQNSSEFNNNTISYSDHNSTDNTLFNPNQYGEYMGVDAHNRVAYMAWSDTRQYYPGSTSNTQKDNVAFANVTFCSAPTGFGAPTVTPGCNGTSVKVDLSWSAPASWGTNATGGTYSVERATSIGGPYTSLVSGLSGTTYTDNTAAASTTYFYRIVAKNNCPGTALTPMSLTSGSTSGTTGVCSGLPPVGDGWPGHGAGNPATFNKSGTNITANWDAITCNSTNAIIVYGTIGNYSAYVGSVDCAAGTSGTKTFTPPAGDLWFNILWKNGSTTGHPGYSSAGERTWSSVGLCSTLADNFADNVCN